MGKNHQCPMPNAGSRRAAIPFHPQGDRVSGRLSINFQRISQFQRIKEQDLWRFKKLSGFTDKSSVVTNLQSVIKITTLVDLVKIILCYLI